MSTTTTTEGAATTSDTTTIGTKKPPAPRLTERILPLLTFFATMVIIYILVERPGKRFEQYY